MVIIQGIAFPTTLATLLLAAVVAPASSQDVARIIGGTAADPFNYEFYASTDQCGASLIHEDVLLSAAHCRGTFLGQSIYMGGTKEDGSDALETMNGVDELLHPSFSSTTLVNDIMLVKLNKSSRATPAAWNSNAALPSSATGDMTTIGFGHTSWQGQKSEILLQVDIPFVDTGVCNAPNSHNGDIDGSVMFCAGGGGKDACQGKCADGSIHA